MSSKKMQFVLILSVFAFLACGGSGKTKENLSAEENAAAAKPQKTIENLQTAITNESRAGAKYKVLALKAEKEGCKNLAKMFDAASFAEQVPVSFQSVLLNLLSVQFVPEAEIPVIHIGMEANIREAVQTQTAEFSSLYPSMIEDAKAENVEQAILSFTFSMEAKKKNVELYEQALTVFAKKHNDKAVSGQWYVCPQCGCLFTNVSAVDACTVCGEAKGNFRKF